MCSIETLGSQEREPIHLTNVLRTEEGGSFDILPHIGRKAGLDCPHERFPPGLASDYYSIVWSSPHLGVVWL